MKRNRLWVVILAVCVVTLVLTGCSLNPGKKITKAMRSWIGQPVSSLMLAWGPPQQVFGDGQGGRVIVYTEQRVFGVKPPTSTTYSTGEAFEVGNMIWGSETSTTTYHPGKLYGYTAWRAFRITAEGTVYGFGWKGLSSGPDIIVEGRQLEPGKSRELEVTIYEQKEKTPGDGHRLLRIELPGTGNNVDGIEHAEKRAFSIEPTDGVLSDGRKWPEGTLPAIGEPALEEQN